jgi:hypothetical protein
MQASATKCVWASAILLTLLQRHQNTSIIGQRCAGFSLGPASWKHQIVRHPRRTPSPLCAGIGFRYIQHRFSHDRPPPPEIMAGMQLSVASQIGNRFTPKIKPSRCPPFHRIQSGDWRGDQGNHQSELAGCPSSLHIARSIESIRH